MLWYIGIYTNNLGRYLLKIRIVFYLTGCRKVAVGVGYRGR